MPTDQIQNHLNVLTNLSPNDILSAVLIRQQPVFHDSKALPDIKRHTPALPAVVQDDWQELDNFAPAWFATIESWSGKIQPLSLGRLVTPNLRTMKWMPIQSLKFN